MKIEISVLESTIANMMISAIESGDPVTTASKGGWCNGINLRNRKTMAKHFDKDGCWWAKESLYKDPRCVLEIAEVVDESTGKEQIHAVCLSDIKRGLGVMAKKYPHIFAQIINDDTDAPCADIFLQCILFGEEKYA